MSSEEQPIEITNIPDLADLQDLIAATGGIHESVPQDDGSIDIENFQQFASATESGALNDK